MGRVGRGGSHAALLAPSGSTCQHCPEPGRLQALTTWMREAPPTDEIPNSSKQTSLWKKMLRVTQDDKFGLIPYIKTAANRQDWTDALLTGLPFLDQPFENRIL